MKIIYFLFIFISFFDVYCNDSIVHLFKKHEGQYVTQAKFVLKQKDIGFENLISIPVLSLEGVFNCDSLIESIVSVDVDVNFQEILYVKKKKQEIHSYKLYPAEYFSPTCFKSNPYANNGRFNKKIYQFKIKNDIPVFLLNSFKGYCCVKNGKIYHLKNMLFYVRLTPLSSYLCHKYGEDLINDIINDSVIYGKKYSKRRH